MPRVNRDLQRRLAARRERERRRPPSERRYRFAPADAVDTQAEPEDELFDGAPEMLAESEAQAPERPRRSTTTAAKAAPATRSTQRANYKPFSAYAADYAYVGRDLRRIFAVVGSLLVVLIVLHFVLPR